MFNDSAAATLDSIVRSVRGSKTSSSRTFFSTCTSRDISAITCTDSSTFIRWRKLWELLLVDLHSTSLCFNVVVRALDGVLHLLVQFVLKNSCSSAFFFAVQNVTSWIIHPTARHIIMSNQCHSVDVCTKLVPYIPHSAKKKW